MNHWSSTKNSAGENKYHRSKMQIKMVNALCFTHQANWHNQPARVPVQTLQHTEYRKPKILPYPTVDIQHFIVLALQMTRMSLELFSSAVLFTHNFCNECLHFLFAILVIYYLLKNMFYVAFLAFKLTEYTCFLAQGEEPLTIPPYFSVCTGHTHYGRPCLGLNTQSKLYRLVL